jgi:hypothetical protein
MREITEQKIQVQKKQNIFAFITIVLDQEVTVFDAEQVQAIVVTLLIMCYAQRYTLLTILVKNQVFHTLHISVYTKSYAQAELNLLVDPTAFLHIKATIESLPKSFVAFSAFYITKKDTTLFLDTKQSHAAACAKSSVLVQGIADCGAKVVHNGNITITKAAIQTIAKQTSKHITLSPMAFVYAKPVLDVMQNAVQCSHGSAIGVLQNTMLFYLQSRGYTRKDAAYWLLSSIISNKNNKHMMLHQTLRSVMRDNKELE